MTQLHLQHHNSVKCRRKIYSSHAWCDEVFDHDKQAWVPTVWTKNWVGLSPQDQGEVEIHELVCRNVQS